MHVLFLEIDTENEWAVASIGPAALASYLRKHGHLASGLRVPVDMSPSELLAKLRQLRPQLLAVSLTTRQWLRFCELIVGLDDGFEVPLIAGGLHPTFSPEAVLQQSGVDFVCLGEGEEALLELVEQLERGDPTPGQAVKNVWSRGGSRPELRPPFSPPDALPFLARDMLDEKYGVVHMTTQRGCPFPCSYCAARQYHDLYGGVSQYGRRRSPDHVLDELDEIRRTGELNYIIFLDDTFTIQPSWVHEFCQRYARVGGPPFSLHARADTVDAAMLEALVAAGCRHIVYGVESGSPRIRRDVMRRPITNEQMIEAFRMSREAGVMATANYMLGLPFETRADLEQTIALHLQLKPEDFGYFVFYPYPGTELFHVCRREGFLPENYLELPANHRTSILQQPTLTDEDIAEFYDRFTALREGLFIDRCSTASPQEQQQVRDQVRQAAAKG